MAHEKNREPVFVCPACGNTATFYETGLANVKMKSTFNNETHIAESESIDLGDFVGSSEITCTECGSKV